MFERIVLAKEGYGLGKPEGWDGKQFEGCDI